MSGNIMRMIRRKRRLWRAYSTGEYYDRDYRDFLAYKEVQKELRKEIKKAKRKLEKNLAKKAKKNPKKFYAYLKSKTCNRVSVGPLIGEEGLVTDDKGMAGMLNAQYTSVFTSEDTTNMPDPEFLYTGDDPLSEVRFEREEVEKKLRNIKASGAPGPDKLWSKVLHDMADVLAGPLTIIFGKLMEEGRVPMIWRMANVCPIFKKGAKGDPANYRPVSLTCVVGKVMESLIRDKIVEHLERNNLIRPSQHGFMAGRSTATNLLVYMEALTKMMDESHAVDVLYLDFAKAFDKVPHQRLLEKCRGLGLEGSVLEWIRVWLEGRKQRVVLNGEASEWADVLSGVPQGSVLGPTLFLIFINDIDKAVDVTSSVLLKFADDTKVGRVVESREQQVELQDTIKRLVAWSVEWQMLFNSEKCHILHLGGNNNRYEYTMGGSVLETVEYEKDVGVIIHQSLKPSMQCARAAARANAILGQLSRAVSYRDKVTFIKLFKVYVRPHLEYAVVSWSPWTVEDKEVLEKVQRRAVGMVSNLRGRTYEARLAELGMTTLSDRRVRGDMIATYKIMSGKDKVEPGVFFDLVAEGAGPRTRAVTGVQNIRVVGSRLDLRRYSFSQRVVNMWNSLPDTLKGVGTVLGFKVGYDEWMSGGRLGA
jgi:ribonuclease P/MRP protein subunit RPP40